MFNLKICLFLFVIAATTNCANYCKRPDNVTETDIVTPDPEDPDQTSFFNCVPKDQDEAVNKYFCECK